MSIFDKKIRSRILNAVGTFVNGPPKSLGLPDDVYHMPSDRVLPPPCEDTLMTQMARIYTNRVRLGMTLNGYGVAFVWNVVFFIIAAIVVLPKANQKYGIPVAPIGKSIGSFIESKLPTKRNGYVIDRSQFLPPRQGLTEMINQKVAQKGEAEVCAELNKSLNAYANSPRFKTDAESQTNASYYLYEFDRLDCGK